MNIQIQKSVLEKMLTRSQSFLGKDLSDITSQINLIAIDGALTTIATDYSMGVKSTSHELFLVDEGNVIVQGQKLLSSVKAMKSGEIVIKLESYMLTISQGRSKFKLPLFASAKAPSFPEYDNLAKLDINSIIMIDSFKKVSPAIDANNPKVELGGSIVNIMSDRVEFAATDTKRLHLVNMESSSNSELSIIVPKKAITEMQKIFFDDVEMFYSLEMMVVKTDNTVFFTKLINGKYPDYNRIVPKSCENTIKLNKIDVIEAIKQINAISSEVKITFTRDMIEIESLSSDNTQAKTSIEVNTNLSEDIIVHVNSAYIIDFLNSVIENEFDFKINEANMPFVLECEDLKAVVMPIIP